MSLVCFRACPPRDGETADERAARLDRLNEQIMHAVNATGEAFLSHTKLNDLFTLRLAVGNIRTTEAHVARVWQLLRDACERLDPADGVEATSRQRHVGGLRGTMPRYYFHLRLGPRIVARDDVGHECPDDAAAGEFARLGTGLFVLDPFLPSLFEQYCFEVFTEDGVIVSRSGAG